MNDDYSQLYEFEGFRVDAGKRLIYGLDGEPLPLSPKVFETLLYLIENRQKVVEKDDLMQAIWQNTFVEENNLNKNISTLRRVLGEKRGEHRFIVTVPGHGYRFVPEVKIIEKKNAVQATEQSADELDILPAKTPPRPSKIIFFLAAAGISVLILAAGVYFYYGRNSSKTAPDNKIKTLAVLPFAPIVAENRNEAFELGMADSLISKLAESHEIIVRPFDSVRRYASLEQDTLAAGRELGTDAVLSGTIQTADDRIRVSARLFRTADGKQLWTGQFDEKLTDIFAVQDSISQRVASALKIRFKEEPKKRGTENLQAYEFYMKGRFHSYKALRTELETGISYFQKACEADPNYALAYVGLADAYRAMSLAGEQPSDAFLPKAKAAANKALETDAELSEAHAVLGSIMFWYDWDWNAAEQHFKRALELDPNSSDTRQFYAHLLSNTGRHAEALAQIKRARELDPLNLRVNALEAMFLLHAGRTDEAIDAARKNLELDSNFWLTNTVLSWAYINKGMFSEAVAVTRRQSELSPNISEPVASGIYALVRSGRVEEARILLGKLVKAAGERYVFPYNLALAYNGVGEREKAFEYLEKGFTVKDLRMAFLKVDRRWDNLRSEPRFIDLLRRINLE